MTIAELLNAKESELVEFKEAKNTFELGTLVKYACAVSNHGGGRVVFGITGNHILPEDEKVVHISMFTDSIKSIMIKVPP